MKTLVLLASLSFATPAASFRTTPMLATAYCLRGHTATGQSTHHGSIAVDPNVIPLGRRVWVQGYGWGVADDTGGSIRGNHVDVWMSSCSAALRWGAPMRLVAVR